MTSTGRDGMQADTHEDAAPFVQFDDFLSPAALEQLVAFVQAREHDLSPSSVITASPDENPDEVRRSRTLFDLDEIWPLFEQQLTGLLPAMRVELGVPHFRLDHIEHQLTVHHDGDFFGPHNDNGGDLVATRMLTFVYYINIEPRRFEGGELWLYSSVERDGYIERGTDHTVVQPKNNSIVFFPSWVHHEVRPVRALAEGLAGCRMTINGWYRAQQPTGPAIVVTDPAERTAIQATRLPFLTTRGFDVIDTPADVHDRLLAAYRTGLGSARSEGSDPTYLTNGDPSFVEIGDLADEIGREMQSLHESWSGQALTLTAAYGIRTYRRGQTLARHCDRVETHVVSAVVHIDHESDAPWPLIVEDHDGVAHEVHLEPGQTLLYESATCPHARPQPFEGEHYGSLFLHYKPIRGWDFRSADLFSAPITG